jgi:hypothetical protein
MRLATAILAAATALTAVGSSQGQGWYNPPGSRYYSRGYYGRSYVPYNQPYNQYYPPQYNNQYYPPQYNPGYGRRHLWVYNEGNAWTQGQFQQVGGGQWVETNPEASFRYQEVGRNPGYVELYDPDRGLYVRLYNDHLVQRQAAYGTWLPGYWGRWE